MWQGNWRDEIWDRLGQGWDLIVIGGGITGAGILREATRAGLRTLLVEAHDFASGTSSRSSKLVHGGFRYLRNGQIKLTFESVRERERLLREGRGLINRLSFLIAHFENDKLPPWLIGLGLSFYDLLALNWGHRYYDAAGMLALCPQLTSCGLKGGYRYFDALTDDARLVLRLIREAIRDGGTALNYAPVISLCRDDRKQVRGVVLEDRAGDQPNRTCEVFAPVVINATGAWSDHLRRYIGGGRKLRKLRGSHLVFPAEKLPLTRAVSIWHPRDTRPVFAFPWESVTVIGTTDVDHGEELQVDPCISAAEADYLLEAVHHAFSTVDLDLKDVLCTFSGIRPVLDTGKANPSKESREHVLWLEYGMLTITGGKLTTFRLMAHDALKAVRNQLPGHPRLDRNMRMLDVHPQVNFENLELGPATRLNLLGRYGLDLPALLASVNSEALATVGNSSVLWAELGWEARTGGVVHLDDLLFRRVRVGLLLPNGGLDYLSKIRATIQPELGWSDARWQHEITDYTKLWQQSYSLPTS